MNRKEFLINTFNIESININDVLQIEYKDCLYRMESDNSISYWHSDNEKTKPSKILLNSLLDDLKSDWSTYQYARDRKREYPSIPDQFDMMYHDINIWKNTILSIKTKYPKGE